MSIKEMTRVWSGSKTEKTALLVMLALADMADDDGICYPRQDTIAEKARTTRRTVLSIIQSCVSNDELAFMARKGRQHVYCLLVGLDDKQRKERLDTLKEKYPGELHTCEKTSQGGCEKISHPPVLETSHPPVQVYAQTCTRSVIETSVDPKDKDSVPSEKSPEAKSHGDGDGNKIVPPALEDSKWTRLVVEHSFHMPFEKARERPQITAMVHNILKQCKKSKVSFEELEARYEVHEDKMQEAESRGKNLSRMSSPGTIVRGIEEARMRMAEDNEMPMYLKGKRVA